ncbi:MAG: hypothetical protein RIT04_282 [Candidatus Parcubacteria bacterium]|jgi:hypothetical protein
MFDSMILVFFITLLAIVGMFVLKAIEIRTGKQSVLSKLGKSTDQHVHSAYDSVRYVLSHMNRNTAVAATQWVAVHVLSWLRAVYIKAYHIAHRHPHSKKVIDMVRGKGEVNLNGGSSFFLKQIAGDKATVVGAVAGDMPEPRQTVAEIAEK